MTEPIKLRDLPKLVGSSPEPSEWMEITQKRVNRFAAATNDYQFIHTDPEKAAQTSFGGTIAHGFLTQALLPFLLSDKTWKFDDAALSINYGSDKLRFIRPVRVGERIRARQTMQEAVEKSPGRWLVRWLVTVEIESSKQPALVAEYLEMKVMR